MLGIVSRSVLKSDYVHGGNTKLDQRLIAFDDDIERSVSVRMGIVLAMLVFRCQSDRCKEDRNGCCG